MRWRDERGLTLIELLVSCTFSLIVLGATLTTFNSFERTNRDNDARNDSAQLARNALDSQARQLRNLAKRVASPVIDTVSGYDLIFQTSDPSRTWVRYCLDVAAPASLERGRLWKAELTVVNPATPAPVTAGMRAGCPGTGWTATRVAADHLTNRRGGQDRPLFRYVCGSGSLCTAGPGTFDGIVSVTAETIVDTTPGTGPAELPVVSGVFLRNQNQAPSASYVSTPSSGSRTVLLNASASTDFEGRTLDYYWFKGVLPSTTSIDCAHPTVSGSGAIRTLWGAAGFIGSSITRSYEFPLTDGLPGTTRNIGLVVCDAGDRYATAGVPPQATIPVQIPA